MNRYITQAKSFLVETLINYIVRRSTSLHEYQEIIPFIKLIMAIRKKPKVDNLAFLFFRNVCISSIFLLMNGLCYLNQSKSFICSIFEVPDNNRKRSETL